MKARARLRSVLGDTGSPGTDAGLTTLNFTGEEPFAVGADLVGGSRTVTDAEIAFLPALMGATNALFHDEVTASNLPPDATPLSAGETVPAEPAE